MTKTLTGPCRNQGFALLSFSLFLGLFLAVVFSYSFVNYIFQSKGHAQRLCFIDAAQAQKTLLSSEKFLFSLNPASTALRTKIKVLQAQLVVALASQNAPLVAEIELQLNLTRQEQLELASQQNLILQKMQFTLDKDMRELVQKANSQSKYLNSSWTNYLSVNEAFQIKNFPKIAISPDLEGGLAPNYEFQNDYVVKQRLAFAWHNRFATLDSAQRVQRSTQHYKLLCAITPEGGRPEWKIKINLDKY